MFRRAFATAAGAAGKAKPARQSSFVRVWMTPKEAWPIIVITAGAVTFSSYKIYQTLAGPDFHFNRQERSTIDYLENARDPSSAIKWGESAFHKGPSFIRERLIKRE